MRFNSKEAIEKVHLISEQSLEDTKIFFEALLTYIVLNFAEGQPTVLPGIGELHIQHLHDDITSEGKKAVLQLDFFADDYLTKNIGQIVDKEESEIEKRYKARIKNLLNEILLK